MRTLDLQSERYSPTGNAAAEGIKNQLGRPRLHPISILVRETVQNSWDARQSGERSVTYGIDSRVLDRDEFDVLRAVVLGNWPPGLPRPPLFGQEGGQQFRVMAIYDRGTSGLGGPTRADVLGRGPERADFVQFLRNVGEPPDVEFGGGTYGYGKAAAYLASSARTVCVHTHCLNGGRPESRFIAAALGGQFSVESGPQAGRYTGRHWWGIDINGTVDPVAGAEADELASALGLPEYKHGDRGTTLLILDPIFEDTREEQRRLALDDPATIARNIIVETILWYFWPKMLVSRSGEPGIDFQLTWDGSPIELPRPEDVDILKEYVSGMRELQRGRTAATDPLSRFFSIESQRPARSLGSLLLRRFVPYTAFNSTAGEDSPAPVRERCHHVAYMRRAQLVVKYGPGPVPDIGELDYCGVFVTEADPEVDRAFAASEPPTHDDWVPDTVQDRSQKSFVRVALRRIDDTLREFARPRTPTIPGMESIAPLGAFAERMADLLPASTGAGAGPSTPEGREAGRGGGGAPRARVVVVGQPSLVNAASGMALTVSFEVKHSDAARDTLVEADPVVLLDGPGFGSQERDVDDMPSPSVLEWIAPDGTSKPGSRAIEVPARVTGTWQVIVSVPPDTAVGVELSATTQGVR